VCLVCLAPLVCLVCLVCLAPLGRRKMHVRVKFVDGRAGSRDTARHPFEGQPHGGSRRAKCPHLVDIRGEGPPNARWVCLGPVEPTDSRSARADSAPAWERRAERGSRLPETAPRPAARRYEARSLTVASLNTRHYTADAHESRRRRPVSGPRTRRNGCAEKFSQRLKEPILWLERFATFEELLGRRPPVRRHL
jgi:hypothetical protein